ncbi:hypothetical protein SDC9_31803 [bioreactor metagenome]|uniref:Uncharacterized protein n=1 Tax=bioreactor metagenome TaxID=1076179 RepID=A0A644V3B5_9ZZZZ
MSVIAVEKSSLFTKPVQLTLNVGNSSLIEIVSLDTLTVKGAAFIVIAAKVGIGAKT